MDEETEAGATCMSISVFALVLGALLWVVLLYASRMVLEWLR